MQIDWLTVVAQITNFLALVWLLQRFLYKPITNAMRRREERIEERLSEAKAARAEAEEEAEKLRKERADLDKAKDDILDKARAEAGELRECLEDEIRKEMEDDRQTWRRHLAEEREDFARALQRRAARQLLDIAARVLADFADADLSEAVARTFVARLDTLDEQTRERLAAAAGRADGATVETGRALGSSARSRITRALHKVLSTDIPVEYHEDEGVLLGVRLLVGEQTVEWSAARHLKRLETVLDEILESESRSSPGTGRSEDHAGAKERTAERRPA